MYQSAVAGRRDFGAAVSEGWSLARANLGAMIIFWLLLLLVSFVLSALRGMFDAVLSVPLMSNWFQVMSTVMQGNGRGFVPLTRMMSGPFFVVLGLVSTLLWFLIATFTQTLNLTLYSGVYQHLTGIGPAPDTGVPASPVEPALVTTVEPEAAAERLVVPPPSPTEEESPLTL
jgi:hypothetical protein